MLELCFGGHRATGVAKTVLRTLSWLSSEGVTQVDRLQLSRKDIQDLMTLGEEGVDLGEEVELAGERGKH